MQVYNHYGMSQVAAAFTAVLGVEAPRQANTPAEPLMQLLRDTLPGGVADKVVIYNPDAIAEWIYQKYTPDFLTVTGATSLALPLKTVMPSVTPVCFGTMYTGTDPEIHGIRKYEKPVIRTDSVYDALIRAGKRCAICSTVGASMSRIYLERDMDYFVDYETDEEATAKGIELIKSGKYDFISIYNGWYDHTMHGTCVESPEALQVMRDETRMFGEIVDAVKESYKNENVFLGFCTDHGCHDNDNGHGTHGTDMYDDLNVLHFFGTIRNHD